MHDRKQPKKTTLDIDIKVERLPQVSLYNTQFDDR